LVDVAEPSWVVAFTGPVTAPWGTVTVSTVADLIVKVVAATNVPGIFPENWRPVAWDKFFPFTETDWPTAPDVGAIFVKVRDP
jgi:hypothetical protein